MVSADQEQRGPPPWPMTGLPYQPVSSGARSVTPVLNMAKPPSVFS